jgi:hypothetical protein
MGLWKTGHNNFKMFMYSELQKPGSSVGTGYGLDDLYSIPTAHTNSYPAGNKSLSLFM